MSAPEALSSELRRLVRAAQSEERLVSLSAAVVRGREVVWTEAVGFAVPERGIEATPDTQYRVGSITKTFTAAALMQLRDDGKLSLDDPVEQHLPDVPHKGVTLRRMLVHASGLQREVPGEIWETMEFPTREALIESLGQAEQVLPPGFVWHYSNLAFALLGEVVARCAATAYERYVEERLFQPVGLERTTWEPVEPYARGYLVEPYDERLHEEPLVDLRAKRAAGQLWSTTADLCWWAAFLADPDPGVLRRETAEEMRTFQMLADHERWSRGWGLGLQLFRADERIFFGHTGGMPGFITAFAYSARDRVGATALTSSTSAPRLVELCLELAVRAVEGLPAEQEPWRPGAAAPPEIAALLGSWWFEGYELVFRYRDGLLEARGAAAGPDEPPSVFAPEGPDRFRVHSGPERGELLRVVRDETGEPVKLYFATYPYTRKPIVFGG